MKTLKNFLNEADVSSSKVDSAISDEAKRLQDEVQKVLGSEYTVKASLSTLGGVKNASVFLLFYHKDVKVTWHNSPVGTQFVMNTMWSGDKTIWWKWELMSRHHLQKPSGIKFIAFKSRESMKDADDKLISWIKKNKPAYDALLAKELNK